MSYHIEVNVSHWLMAAGVVCMSVAVVVMAVLTVKQRVGHKQRAEGTHRVRQQYELSESSILRKKPSDDTLA